MTFLQLLSFASNAEIAIGAFEASSEFKDLLSELPALGKLFTDLSADSKALNIAQVITDIEEGIADIKAKV